MANIGDVEIREHTFKFDDESGLKIPFVLISEIPEIYKDEFVKWLYISTCPIIPGYDDAIYSWDYERWYNLKTEGIPTMWD